VLFSSSANILKLRLNYCFDGSSIRVISKSIAQKFVAFFPTLSDVVTEPNSNAKSHSLISDQDKYYYSNDFVGALRVIVKLYFIYFNLEIIQTKYIHHTTPI
jgi:hypothetical protein